MTAESPRSLTFREIQQKRNARLEELMSKQNKTPEEASEMADLQRIIRMRQAGQNYDRDPYLDALIHS